MTKVKKHINYRTNTVIELFQFVSFSENMLFKIFNGNWVTWVRLDQNRQAIQKNKVSTVKADSYVFKSGLNLALKLMRANIINVV